MEAADRSVTLAPAHLSTRCSDFTCAAGAWARPRCRHAAPRSAAQRSAAPCSGGGGTRPVGQWPACCQVLHSQPQVGSSRQRGLRPIRQLRADTQSAAVRCSPPAALGRRAQPQKPPAAALGRLAARRAQLAPRLRLGVGPDLHEAVPLPGQPPPDRAGGALACSRAGGKTASQAGHPGAPGPSGAGRRAVEVLQQPGHLLRARGAQQRELEGWQRLDVLPSGVDGAHVTHDMEQPEGSRERALPEGPGAVGARAAAARGMRGGGAPMGRRARQSGSR